MGRRHTHDRQAPSLGARCLGAPDRIICHVARRVEPLQPLDQAPIEFQLTHFRLTVLVYVREAARSVERVERDRGGGHPGDSFRPARGWSRYGRPDQ